jgi:hypothetical protein
MLLKKNDLLQKKTCGQRHFVASPNSGIAYTYLESITCKGPGGECQDVAAAPERMACSTAAWALGSELRLIVISEC